ncbi:prephenate dehydrogenase/arogenate dehydrogenase family protein [Candidatus Poribacteria bacterium]|nr:prephenate dehydrogenase/arogenate dehydrogenase family protein [Candidatus Poribacteria bacterium]
MLKKRLTNTPVIYTIFEVHHGERAWEKMFADFSQIRNITILGVGLIGGSLGLALKAKGFRGEVTGLGRRMQTLDIALERGAVDNATTDFHAGVGDADLIVVGTPVDLIPEMVQRIAEIRTSDPRPLIITDVGSIKGQIVEEIENLLTARGLHFVGSHPMAGSEKTSVASARPDLFDGAKCIVTPTDNTDPQALKLVTSLWQSVDMQVCHLSPTEHDMLIAGASHLPHLIASILTNTVGEIGNDTVKALDFAATGFRDTTRIAAGSPQLWRAIFMQNAHSLLPMIDSTIQNLAAFKTLLENRDDAEIERLLAHAKILRDTLEE